MTHTIFFKEKKTAGTADNVSSVYVLVLILHSLSSSILQLAGKPKRQEERERAQGTKLKRYAALPPTVSLLVMLMHIHTLQ